MLTPFLINTFFGPTVYVPLAPAQRFWYLRLLNRADSMTLSEIFTPTTAAPATSTSAQIEEEGVDTMSEQNEGEVHVRENIKQAMANSKAGGEGNAWMKMMNLYVPHRLHVLHIRTVLITMTLQSYATSQVLQPPLPPSQRRVRAL